MYTVTCYLYRYAVIVFKKHLQHFIYKLECKYLLQYTCANVISEYTQKIEDINCHWTFLHRFIKYHTMCKKQWCVTCWTADNSYCRQYCVSDASSRYYILYWTTRPLLRIIFYLVKLKSKSTFRRLCVHVISNSYVCIKNLHP